MAIIDDDTNASAAPAKPKGGSRTKGIIAIVAGAALLIGGASTYAYWSTQQAITASPIQAGDLNLGLGTPSWTLKGVLTNTAPVTTLSAVKVVPGDILTLSQPVTVTLVGDTIGADLSIDTTGAIPAPAASAFSLALTTGGVGTANGTNTYRLHASDSGTITASLVITFSGSTANRDLVNTTIDLTKIKFTLTQASS